LEASNKVRVTSDTGTAAAPAVTTGCYVLYACVLRK